MMRIVTTKHRLPGTLWLPGKRRNPDQKRWKKGVLAAILIFMGMQGVFSQCLLSCRGTDASNALQLVVRNDCTLRLTPAVLLSDADNCPGSKLIVVREKDTGLIAEGKDEVVFPAGGLLGKVLQVTVEDVNSGLFCVSFITPVDQTAPSISCSNLSVSCMADTAAVALGFPEAADNCDGEVELSYRDIVMESGCAGPVVAVINRKWEATDAAGNSSTCTQMITVQRHQAEDLAFPKDAVLSCLDPNADPTETGRPTIGGQPLEQSNFCNLEYTFSDDTTFQNSGTFRIERTWQVVDKCTNQLMTDQQQIVVRDDEKPVLTCPENLVVDTEPNRCYANFKLPRPEYSDACDPFPLLTVSTSFGEVGLGEHKYVPLGTHSVQYSVRDAAGNTASCTIQVTVQDGEEPTAVCEEVTVSSLPSTGFSRVHAATFNQGSYDNCRPNVYFKARRMTPGGCNGADGDDGSAEGSQEWFDDFVTFCCEEAGQGEIMVVLRVYEVDPGPGPVDPAREAPGGDLFGHYGECMVSVTVQDKKGPLLKCPEDVTTDCTTGFFELVDFGSPAVTEYCGFTIDSTTVRDIDNCGTGSILRRWTATDSFGNTSACEQHITVENTAALTAELIEWPENYVVEGCGDNLAPEMLPDGFAVPVIDNSGLCSQAGINYDDEVFSTTLSSGCFQILRRWTVVDLCRYEPSQPELGGRYTYTQRIQVVDNTAPDLKVPQDTVVGTIVSCDGARVILAPAAAFDNCGENITITNDSPYADAGGADASGFYPLGTTEVLFTATDECGNVTRKQMEITVVDRMMPKPVCIKVLAAELTATDDGPSVWLKAEAFDAGTENPCGEELTWTIRRADPALTTPPTTETLVLTCADLGELPIEVWVSDGNGNSDYCETIIDVQDNFSICGEAVAGASGMIAGDVLTEDGYEVEEVMVEVTTGDKKQSMTGLEGYYELREIPFGGDYSLIPSKDQSPMNGVSTLDLVLISKHILGVSPLDSPYKIIAADIDRSNHVSTLDMIRLRKLILGVDDALPDGKPSWRFINSEYRFPDPGNPFSEPFPEVYNINDFSEESMYVDFTAIKVGDVNNSVRPNSLATLEERASYGSFSLHLQDQRLQAGETVELEIRPSSLRQVSGYQFALAFDTDLLEFDLLEPGDVPGMSLENFGLNHLNEGVIATSWNVMEENSQTDDPVLFRLHFRARSQTTLREALRLEEGSLHPEAYDLQARPMEVNLVFDDPGAPIADGWQLFQNQPNPFRSQTVVAFQLPEPEDVRLSIFDLSGKLVFQRQQTFGAGYNEFEVYAADLATSGILYYQVEAGGKSETRKMILIS